MLGCRGAERSRGLHGRRLQPAPPPAAATASQEVDPNQTQQHTPADDARLAPRRRRSSVSSGEQRGMMLALRSLQRFVLPSGTVKPPPAASRRSLQQYTGTRADKVPLLRHARWAAWCAADAGAHLQLP